MTATLLAGAFASFLMGVGANYPFVLAPGVAMSVYFTYSLLQEGRDEWQKALGVVFLCGALLLLLKFNGYSPKNSVSDSLSYPVRSGFWFGSFFSLDRVKNVVSLSATLPH